MIQSAIAVTGDLKRALKGLRKDIGFSAVTTLILALSIGGATSIFSLVNSIVLNPLPYPESNRLAYLAQTKDSQELSPSWLNFLDWKVQCRSFGELVGSWPQEFTLTGAWGAERVRGQVVTVDFFSALKVRPLLGRAFQPPDNNSGSEPVVLLSHALWQRRFGARADIVGSVVNLDSRAFTIIGVLPRSFQYYQESEVFAPISLFPDKKGPRWNRQGMTVIGRLAPGVTFSQAQSEMDLIAANQAREYPDANAGNRIIVDELSRRVTGKTDNILMTLFGAILLVLVIACANIANLQLARGTTKQKEIAICAALGASRLRIAMNVLTQGFVLSFFGATLGLVIAWGGSTLIVGLLPSNVAQLVDVKLDVHVFAFTCAALIATAIAFGLLPAAQAAKSDLRIALTERVPASGFGIRRSMSVRSILVVLQIAFAITLLIGASLMLRSVLQLLHVDPGFRLDRVVTAQVFAPALKYQEPVRVVALYDRLLSKISSYPGVESAGIVGCVPLGGACFRSVYQAEGQPTRLREDLPRLDMNIADVEYFRTVQIPLVSGRYFENRDEKGSEPVAIVSNAVARRFWPNQNAIGKHLTQGGPKDGMPRRTVVGVVRDVRRLGLDAASVGEVYIPFRQFPLVRMNLVVRARNTDMLVDAIRSSLQSIDPEIPLYQYRTLRSIAMDSISSRRLLLVVLSCFASLSLVLSISGVYGVVSYTVSQCTHELAIRAALGATFEQNCFLVLHQGLILVLLGLAIGTIGASFLTRFLESWLYGIPHGDIQTYAICSIVVAIAALAACYIPASRTFRIEAASALRAL